MPVERDETITGFTLWPFEAYCSCEITSFKQQELKQKSLKNIQ